MHKLMALTVAAIVLLVPTDPATAKWKDQCHFQHLQPGVWTDLEEHRTAWCVVERWPVDGGHRKFNRVAACESGWGRFAYNPAGPYVGLFQHVLSAWPARVRSYEPRHWELRLNWRNSRTQMIVTARMVRSVGWGPWGCG